MANKYKNIKSGAYSSKKEAKRGAELRLLEKAGEISDLMEQKTYGLLNRQYDPVTKKLLERELTYTADFSYLRDGVEVCEDVKGVRTQQYVIRRKLMLWVHNIRVIEV